MDQVRTLVDNGDILNYDACVQYPRIWGLAAANKVPGDDPGLNQSRYKLCTNFYKTGSWRGGISPAIDDRKDTVANDWTPEKRAQYIRVRDDITTTFKNNLNVVAMRSIPAALDYPGAADEVSNAKSAILSLLSRLGAETKRITSYATALQAQQSSELVNEVAETELKLHKLEKENENYKKTADLRKEQTKDVYNKYDSNYHTSVYGYLPYEWTRSAWYGFMPYNLFIDLSPTSRTGILFMAFFFGFAAIIALCVRVATYFMDPTLRQLAQANAGALYSSVSNRVGLMSQAVPELTRRMRY